MARYTATVESAAAIVATAPSGATANGLFANILGSTAAGGGIVKVRRLTLGVRATTAAPTSMQCTVAFARTTARGTATTTNAWAAMDGYATLANNPGVDVAWSTVPTGTWTAPYFWEVSFNTQATVDLPWELLEELMVQPASGNANGLALFNVANALPTSHLYTVGVEIEA